MIRDISIAYLHGTFQGNVIKKASTPIDNELVGERVGNQITTNPLRDIPNLATEQPPLIPPELRAYKPDGTLKPKIEHMDAVMRSACDVYYDVAEDLMLMRDFPKVYLEKMARVRIPVNVKKEGTANDGC